MSKQSFIYAVFLSYSATILCCYFEGKKYGFIKSEWFRFSILIFPSWVFTVLIQVGEVDSLFSLYSLWLVTFFSLLINMAENKCTKPTLAIAGLVSPLIWWLFN